jgi:drug/metabolite transporter (DMT)-like permease
VKNKKLKYTTLFLLVLLWGFTLIHFNDLPEEIPIHYNAKGIPDGFDTRIHIWGLPIIATLLFFLLNGLQRRTGMQQIERQLLQWMQLLILGIFTYIQLQTFFIAVNKSNGLGSWFLPLVMISFFVPIFWVIRKQQRS